MARGQTDQVLAVRVGAASTAVRRPDHVVVEEPLEIRLDGQLVTVTMRTPGHDFELAAGFCHAEGLLAGATVERIRYCATGSAVETAFNVVTVETGVERPPVTARLTTTSSACGVCGTASVDALVDRLRPIGPVPALSAGIVSEVEAAARGAQLLFERTHGSHAAAAFDLGTGAIAVIREDIGRHNAVDKVVGALLLDGRVPATGLGLFVSGRASFEMAQKAWAAGFAWLVAVGAASSLAVDIALRAGMGLAGFVRNGGMTVYTGAEATQ